MKQAKINALPFVLFKCHYFSLLICFCCITLLTTAQGAHRIYLKDSTNAADKSYGKGPEKTKKHGEFLLILAKEEFYAGAEKLMQEDQTFGYEDGNIKKQQKFHDDKSKKNSFVLKHGYREPIPATMKPCNEIFLGASTIFEDSYKRFNTYGGDFAFTYPVCPHVGITGDAGVHFGSSMGTKYTKYQVLIGASLLPVSPDKVSFSPHLLAGIADISAKYESNNINLPSNSSAHLSVAAGTNINFSLDNKANITARADYNPTFSTGGISNNFRLAIGISFNLCSKSKGKQQNETTDEQQPPLKPEYISNTSAHDFDNDPPLFDPDDKTKKKLVNPHTVSVKNCEKGDEEFEYDNDSGKDADATLVVKNEGECKVYVFIEKLLGLPAKGGKKQKKGGATKDKSEVEIITPRKESKENTEEIASYGIEDLQGSDVHSFKIAKGERIRVYIMCGGTTTSLCKFTRNFSVTTNEDINVNKPADIPRLVVDAPKPVKEISTFYHNGNQCISKDLVFYKITNKNVSDTMKVYFKAFSDCDCYFEAYELDFPPTVKKISFPDDEDNTHPKTGGDLGKNENHYNESELIAKPAKNGNPNEGKEAVIKVNPGHRIYLIGRCPYQFPKGGPCKGRVEITGITYTYKSK